MTLTIEQENAYARTIQAGFPLDERPFARLGEELACSEAELLEVARRFQREHKLREISAILEGQALGYDSALVAGTVAADALERVAAIVNQHPTVTHNYQRTHDYNLWFTIAVPCSMGVEATLERLAQRCGVAQFLPLRRTSTFKIGVNFDLIRKQSLTEQRALREVASVPLTSRSSALFRALQTPLPLEPRPFAALAALAGVHEGALLDFAREHLGAAIRRYSATFHHRALGVSGNAMVVWAVEPEHHARIGAQLAAAPEVSHCYARQAIAGFPYSVYSMIHGPDRQAVSEVAARLSQQIGISNYLELFSTREFKKCRLRYFLPELEAWWDAN